MVEKWSVTIFIEKNNTKVEKTKNYIRKKRKKIHKNNKLMDFAIFYDLLLLKTLKQVDTPKIWLNPNPIGLF